MELIENYRPEYVVRFDAMPAPCCCPSCRASEQDDWPRVSIKLKNQQRQSLNAGCETAATEILLNPQAFILHTTQTPCQDRRELTQWDENLNQQCINLAVHPALALETSLYAIGVLLSKAQHHQSNGQHDVQLLDTMGEQLSQLADNGILEQQHGMLPSIESNRIDALAQMGALRLNLNLPVAQKMSMMLKLSELAVMSPSALQQRLRTLETLAASNTFFSEHPHILRNLLIYRLYGEVFPCGCGQHYGHAFLLLTRQIFELKMLCALWLEDHNRLMPRDLVILASAWFSWQQHKTPEADSEDSADYMLLCGLSLI